MKYHAFISYSRKDFDEVNAFVQKIKTEVPEFEYWFDLEGIESGDKFVRKMVSAIDNSERLLFMLSDNSINSEWAEQEVMYARNSDKRIIPILLKGAKLKGWFLFTFGNIDTIDTQDSRQVTKLISNLCRWCESKEEKTVSSPKADAPPETSKATNTNQKETEILSVIKIEGKYGFQFKNGEIAIPCIYDYAWSFSEKRAVVRMDRIHWLRNKVNSKYGYIDLDGNMIIPCIYDNAESFSEGRALVKKDERYWFIDLNGNMVIPYIYYYAHSFSEGRAVVRTNGKYGYIDLNGNMVIPCIYDNAESFSEGRAAVKKDGKYGYIDLDGKLVIPYIDGDYSMNSIFVRFDKIFGPSVIGTFHQGRAYVNKNGRYGYIDLNGNKVIPCIYDSADNFSEGRAWVVKDGKYGYIDLNGNWVIPCIYDYADYFQEGRARVKKDGNYYYIDLNGNKIK